MDVVGYSAGGVVAGLWVARDDGAAKARRVVTLGSPLRGTTLAGSAVAFAPDACPVACRQLAPGSAEVRELATAGGGPPLPWLSIWTTADQTVTPPDSARLDGAVDVALQDACGSGPVSHGQLPGDPMAVALVLRGLSVAPLTGRGARLACDVLRREVRPRRPERDQHVPGLHGRALAHRPPEDRVAVEVDPGQPVRGWAGRADGRGRVEGQQHGRATTNASTPSAAASGESVSVEKNSPTAPRASMHSAR